MSNLNLKGLTVRQLQFYAAVCLKTYCIDRGISHSSIDALICHQVSLATAKSLPDWEQSGSRLELGGGDPVPDEIMAPIPADDRRLFYELVDCSVEVGIVDMYGASTDQPSRFAARCIAILDELGIDRPAIGPIRRLAAGHKTDSWGPASTPNDVAGVIREYGFELR